jgi:hypothetical protein
MLVHRRRKSRIGMQHRVFLEIATGAGFQQRLHQAQHFLLLDLALQGAAEGGAGAALDDLPGAGFVFAAYPRPAALRMPDYLAAGAED